MEDIKVKIELVRKLMFHDGRIAMAQVILNQDKDSAIDKARQMIKSVFLYKNVDPVIADQYSDSLIKEVIQEVDRQEMFNKLI